MNMGSNVRTQQPAMCDAPSTGPVLCPVSTSDLSMGCILVQLVLTGRPSILLRLQHYVQYPPPPSPSPHLQPVSDFTSLQARETPSVSGHLSKHRKNYHFRTLLLLILHQRETGINNH